MRHALTHGNHLTRAFHPRRERHRFLRINAGAEIDIDVIQPDAGLLEARFTGSGIADLDLFPLHDLGATGLVNLNRV